jgi:hypothetical protein
LEVDANNNLVLKSNALLSDGDYNTDSIVTGGNNAVITGGTMTGIYAGGNENTTGDIATTISGGTIQNIVIGGALVKPNSAAVFTGDITTTITGGDIDGYIYGAGYTYNGEADVDLEVAKSTITLNGAKHDKYIVSGAHARKGAKAVVSATETTVTGGSYGRLFGGGWAEQNDAYSEVKNATITVNGGLVDYIYAGGANGSDAATKVSGSVNIVLKGGTVNHIFLSGKNENSSVTGNVTLTVDGFDGEVLKRLSGTSAWGNDNSLGTTKVDLNTGLSVDYLDFIDELVIDENCTLEINKGFLTGYENGMKVTLDFDTDETNNKDWTVLSGDALADFNGKLSFYIDENELTLGAEFSEGRGLYRDEDGSYKFGTIVKNG